MAEHDALAHAGEDHVVLADHVAAPERGEADVAAPARPGVIANAFISKAIEFIVGWLTFWIKYFDWIFQKIKKAHIVAGGIYLLLKKNTNSNT